MIANELRAEKARAEQTITATLNEFYERTGCRIDMIMINRVVPNTYRVGDTVHIPAPSYTVRCYVTL